MNKSIIISTQVKQYFSAHATLAALGVKVSEMKWFEPITQKVKIAQKTVKYTPIEKLMDAEIAILAGAHGMVEINKRVRPTGACRLPLGVLAVPSNRWCKTPWMPAARRMLFKCRPRWI